MWTISPLLPRGIRKGGRWDGNSRWLVRCRVYSPVRQTFAKSCKMAKCVVMHEKYTTVNRQQSEVEGKGERVHTFLQSYRWWRQDTGNWIKQAWSKYIGLKLPESLCFLPHVKSTNALFPSLPHRCFEEKLVRRNNMFNKENTFPNAHPRDG